MAVIALAELLLVLLTSPITRHARLTVHLKTPDSRARVHWIVMHVMVARCDLTPPLAAAFAYQFMDYWL